MGSDSEVFQDCDDDAGIFGFGEDKMEDEEILCVSVFLAIKNINKITIQCYGEQELHKNGRGTFCRANFKIAAI